MEDTLSKRIEQDKKLTESEIESGVKLLGAYCRARTKMSIRFALRCVPNVRNYGIFNRVEIENGEMSYCAGQSYTDEIRTVRGCLL